MPLIRDPPADSSPNSVDAITQHPAPKPQRSKFDPTFVPPKGCASRPRLYIVGEAPGKAEVAQREPFVGPAGRMLDKLMAAAGISSSQVRLFNVVPYRPLTKSKSGAIRNRTPTRREIREYSMILFEDIRKTAPRAILASGKVAMAAFGIQLPLREVRKSVFRFEGTPVFVTYHPRYVTYSGGEGSPVWKQVVMDLRTSWERSG